MQTTSQPFASPTTGAAPSAAAHTLDSLSRLSFTELEALYRRAAAPPSIRAADGALRGRMLAVRGLGAAGTTAGWLRRFAGSRSFVWEGKTFASRSDGEGDGHNRIAVAGVLGRQNLFPFTTRLDRSEIDAAPTLVLDYDHAFNPPYIRRIHDEIREVSPGVFLGPAMWKRGSDKLMILWFALDATRAARSRPS